MKINCLELRDQIASEIKLKIDKLKLSGITPSFAIIQINDNPNSNAYIRVKTKKAEELGIGTQVFKFEIRNSKFEKEVENLILKLNQDPSVHGIIIQRPLPKDINEEKLQSLINLEKDIDGLSKNSPFINPLVQAVSHVINYVLSVGTHPLQLNLIVVGKGITAGFPIYRYFADHPSFVIPAQAGIQASFNVSQIDSSTKNPNEILKSADIIISCVGKERIIRRDNIKKDVILISVGQHKDNRTIEQSNNRTIAKPKWTGDYNEEEIKDVAAAYTPTPNGIGPLNVIFLLKNVISAVK